MSLRRTWMKLRGMDCYACRFAEVFRSNGDGQVSRMHTYCRNPRSPHNDRPIPPAMWCDQWQRADDARRREPDDSGLTA